MNGKSPLYIYNSTFFNNFALSATVAYATNQGSMHFFDCDFLKNHALTVGLMDIIDTTEPSEMIHSLIHSNTIVDKSEIISELDDRTH